jgi:hypothetical protein
MALGSTQSLTEMSTSNILAQEETVAKWLRSSSTIDHWGRGAGAVKACPLHTTPILCGHKQRWITQQTLFQYFSH